MSSTKNVYTDGQERALKATLSPPTSHVVVLDSAGLITWTSLSWAEFASQNSGRLESVSVGINYLDVCRRAADTDPIAKRSLEGITAVLVRDLPVFAIEYPCHSPVEERWFLMSVHPMPLDPGGVVIRNMEVSPGKSASLTLYKSDERYWRLIEQSPDAVAVHDNGVLLYANRPAVELFGARHSSSLIGSQLGRFIHPDALPLVRDRYQGFYMGRVPFPSIEEKLVRLDGKSILVELTTIPTTYRGEPAALSVAREISERKRFQEELRRRDRDIAALIENLPDVIFRLDLQLRYTYISPAIKSQIGIRPEQIVGSAVDEILLPGDEAQDLVTRCRKALETGKEVKREFGAEGRYYQMRIIPQFARNGTIEWLLGIAEDITERRRAEEARYRTERQYESLVNSVESIVWELDYPSYSFKFVSKQAERILGYPTEQWLNEPDFFVEHIHPDDRWVPEFCMNATEKGEDHQFEYRMIASDGRVVWLRDMVTVESSNGRPVRIRGVIVDITEARRAKQEREALHKKLELEHARLKQVLRQLPGGVIITEAPSGDVAMVNVNMEKICRRRLDGLKNISEFSDPDKSNLLVNFLGRETIDRLVNRSIHDGVAIEGEEFHILRADGSRGIVSVSSAPIRDHENKVIAGVASFFDITDRKEEERFRLGQNRVLEMIAAGSPVERTLTRLIQVIESCSDGMLGSILLLDADGVNMRHGAAPNLPKAYVEAIDGVAIGPRVGSCGTAMFSGRPVIAVDILSDSRWADYRELTTKFGLRACWSMPILSHGRQVIGSFALYYREKRGPTSKDWRLISTAAHLAGIAIEAQRSEEALRRSEERNRATLRAIPDLIFLLSAEGDYLDCHARPEQLLLPPSQLIGKNIRDVLPRDLAERFAEVCWKVAKIDEPQVMEYELTVGGRRRDSEARIVRAGNNTVLVLVRDITERKHAEKELRRNSEQIRELASKLLTAQEEERNRIARELHDDVLQRVAALSIYLGNLKRSVPEPQDRIVQELANLQRLTTTLADDIRALSHQLHPAVFKDSGVLPALRSFTTQFSRLEGVEVNLSIPNRHDQISQGVGTCIYRVVQESLRNIEKHSGAKRADVTLAIENDEVRLTVSDNGRGFDVQSARGKGLGIISMEERVRLCQGRLEIASAPNAGTILSAQFPVASSKDAVIARQDDQQDQTAGMYL